MRVKIKENEGQVVLIAPHGYISDDTYTDILTEAIADVLDCSYVINTGWKRGKDVDVKNSIANLNDRNHCNIPEINSEFLLPIKKLIKSKENSLLYVFTLHGLSDKIREKDPTLDIIVGYGDGNPPRLICDIWRANMLMDWLMRYNFNVRQGKKGGKYSANHPDNLIQSLRTSANVQCMQLEVIGSLRATKEIAQQTGERLGKVILSMMSERYEPSNRIVKSI